MRAYLAGAGLSAMALVLAGGAEAQTTTSSTDTADATSPEIVVTAQRRNENLMQTPLAASVLRGADLSNKGIVTVDQLQFSIPSVAVDNFGQGLEFNIRGIGKAEHNTQTGTGVITYRDGVATFPGYFQEEPYFDIASVEVLRGPQGTIAGQNSTGGAVFVTTNNPVIDGGYTGYVQGQYGNYNDVNLQGSLNVPISSTLAARVAFFGERRDSFYHFTGPGGTPYTGNPGKLQDYAGRISLLWKPSSSLSVLFKTDLDYLDQGAYPADPYTDRFQFLPGTTTPNPGHTDLFNLTANSPQLAIDKFVRSTLKIDYEFPDGIKFRSVSGYQKGNTRYTADLDGTAQGNSVFTDSVDEEQFSQEFNLLSPDTGRFTWLLGAYGQWNTYYFPDPYQFLVGTPAGNPTTEYKLQGRNPNRSIAAFGQVGFKVTDKLQVTVGGRYTDSHSSNTTSILQYGLLIDDRQAIQSTDFSYKASLGWTIDPHNYLYAFVATGFRPGGLNVPVGIGLPAPFTAEKVTSYEAGYKSTFLDGHVRTTIDGFYNDYKNFQVTIGYPQFPTFGIELNVPNSTKIYGGEAEIEANFGALSFDGGISVIHSELGTFFATDPRVPSTLPCSPATGPVSVTCINLNGRQQTYAPNLTFNFSASYDVALGGGDKLTPRVNFGHIAPQFATLFQAPALGDRLEARNILGAQLAYTHGTFVAALYGSNLTDQHYVGALQSNLDFAGPPRQFGVRVTKTF